jgi:23S rRNA-/tRNA-specific pseudouridylate synthase
MIRRFHWVGTVPRRRRLRSSWPQPLPCCCCCCCRCCSCHLRWYHSTSSTNATRTKLSATTTPTTTAAARSPPSPPSRRGPSRSSLWIPPKGNRHRQPPQQQPLPPPTILYQNNHLLVVHKPPGWHAIPNSSPIGTTTTTPSTGMTEEEVEKEDRCSGVVHDTSKCLLTYLSQQRKLGGGSNKEYLKPLHRIDQPCTGLLLYGKTTKAASRIQTLFSQMSTSTSTTRNNKNKSSDTTTTTNATTTTTTTTTSPDVLRKVYYVMVQQQQQQVRHRPYRRTALSSVEEKEEDEDDDHDTSPVGTWYTLHGAIVPPRRKSPYHTNTASTSKGWSVHMVPVLHHAPNRTDVRQALIHDVTDPDPHHGMRQTKPPRSNSQSRPCSLQYRVVHTYPHHHHPPSTTTHVSSSSSSSSSSSPPNRLYLLQVRTPHGARHVIRALLSCHSMVVMGDVRYGSGGGSGGAAGTVPPLPDQSVALHAYSIQFPTYFQLGSSSSSRNSTTSQVRQQNPNSTTTTTTEPIVPPPPPPLPRYFQAPIPKTWHHYFNCTQSMIDAWERQYPI